MTDHEWMSLMGGGRRLPAAPLLIYWALTAAVFVLAIRGSNRGDSSTILTLIPMSLGGVFITIQYCVSGPLIREIGRLRAELDEIRSQKRSS